MNKFLANLRALRVGVRLTLDDAGAALSFGHYGRKLRYSGAMLSRIESAERNIWTRGGRGFVLVVIARAGEVFRLPVLQFGSDDELVREVNRLAAFFRRKQRAKARQLAKLAAKAAEIMAA